MYFSLEINDRGMLVIYFFIIVSFCDSLAELRTLYHLKQANPILKHVYICTNLACFVA